MLRLLGWALIHWHSTVQLAGLEGRIMEELDLRAQLGSDGLRSPNQLPPSTPKVIAAALVGLVVWVLLRRLV